MSEQYVIDDPKFGKVYVSKTDKSLMMTNQVPDKKVVGWLQKTQTVRLLTAIRRISMENEQEQQFIWELIQRDGTVLEIPPEAVATVKRRWEAGLPIHTRYSGSIPPNQIAAFRPTDKIPSSQRLIEGAAQAFGEPVEATYENGEKYIVARWCKKRVTQQKWEKYYAPSGYKRLAEENGMVTVAFRVPVHQINSDLVQECTEDEIKTLTKKQ